jgi:hypothetical protein
MHGQQHIKPLTFILLTWSIGWAPNNASKWDMGFNLAFKGLIHYILMHEYGRAHFTLLYCVLALVHMHKWIEFQQQITKVMWTTIKTEEQKSWHRKVLLQSDKLL